jgi:FtsP/CotA-like multicopper oxidase with cupredoxin domain
MVNVSKHNVTIQFVLTAIGTYQNAHPIHLHGHTFHVVHVGYAEYNTTTGFVDPNKHSQAIHCGDECQGEECRLCTKPSWNQAHIPDIKITPYTIRKDTVIIPAGGYAVINFISDNPGFWFMHCHIEVHQLEGMAVVINEAFDQQLPTPDGLKTCGDFELTVPEFEATLIRSGST